MDNKIKVTFKVYRFNPEVLPEGYYDTFNIEVPDTYTVLDCLNDIKWDVDGSVTYSRSCRHGICGVCAIRMNGRAKLACKTQVRDVMDKNNSVRVDPMGNMPVIRDLIVDRTKFWKALDDVKPYIEKEMTEHPKAESVLLSQEQQHSFHETDHCIMCGACYSDCPSVEATGNKYLGPAALAKAYRFAADPRESNVEERMTELNKDGGIWDCARCYDCIERCPKGVAPLDQIIRLRNITMDYPNIPSNKGVRHAEGFTESTYRMGILDEVIMSLHTEGPFGMIKHVPLGIRLGMRGKAPSGPFITKTSDNIGEVRKIYKLMGVDKNGVEFKNKR